MGAFFVPVFPKKEGSVINFTAGEINFLEKRRTYEV